MPLFFFIGSMAALGFASRWLESGFGVFLAMSRFCIRYGNQVASVYSSISSSGAGLCGFLPAVSMGYLVQKNMTYRMWFPIGHG